MGNEPISKVTRPWHHCYAHTYIQHDTTHTQVRHTITLSWHRMWQGMASRINQSYPRVISMHMIVLGAYAVRLHAHTQGHPFRRLNVEMRRHKSIRDRKKTKNMRANRRANFADHSAELAGTRCTQWVLLQAHPMGRALGGGVGCNAALLQVQSQEKMVCHALAQRNWC